MHQCMKVIDKDNGNQSYIVHGAHTLSRSEGPRKPSGGGEVVPLGSVCALSILTDASMYESDR